MVDDCKGVVYIHSCLTACCIRVSVDIQPTPSPCRFFILSTGRYSGQGWAWGHYVLAGPKTPARSSYWTVDKLYQPRNEHLNRSNHYWLITIVFAPKNFNIKCRCLLQNMRTTYFQRQARHDGWRALHLTGKLTLKTGSAAWPRYYQPLHVTAMNRAPVMQWLKYWVVPQKKSRNSRNYFCQN